MACLLLSAALDLAILGRAPGLVGLDVAEQVLVRLQPRPLVTVAVLVAACKEVEVLVPHAVALPPTSAQPLHDRVVVEYRSREDWRQARALIRAAADLHRLSVGIVVRTAGATIGMLVLRLRVHRLEDGSRPSLGAALLRWLVFVALLATGIGAAVDTICMIADPRGRSLHDQAARTVVVRRVAG